MYHSSTSTHRTFQSPFKTKKSDSGSGRHGKSSINKNVKTGPNNTPQRQPATSSFTKRIGFWSKFMSSSSKSVTTRGQSPYRPPSSQRRISKNNDKGRSATASASNTAGNSYRFPSPYKQSPYKRSLSQQRRRRDGLLHRASANASPSEEQDDCMYKVVQGMSKMSSYSKDEDYSITASAATASTAAVTHASSSIDDASTVISEVTTDMIGMPRSRSNMSEEKYMHSPCTFHSFKAGSNTFTVDKKYSFIRVVGSGAYGVVVSAHDSSTARKVAIKMVPRAFHDEIDAKRILREIKLLKHLRHENIISILDMMPPLTSKVEDFDDIYIVADLMETDLHRIIYSKQSLSIDHVQYFLYQILRALKYIHSADVLHRDLKPSNLLVNSNCDLKICDFGLARGILSDGMEMDGKNGGSMLLTEYVVTRWYRAPEIMLACHQYSKPIDVWSVGCIFAELLSRKPYFPGDDYIDQLTIITEKLGKLAEEDLDFVTSEKAKRFMRKLPDKPALPLRRQFPNTSSEALDLLGKMLQIHPRKRITVKEALKHPFMASLHSPDDEPEAETPFDFSFEDEKLYRVRLQEMIWQEIGCFRSSCLPVPARRNDVRSGRKESSRRLYHA